MVYSSDLPLSWFTAWWNLSWLAFDARSRPLQIDPFALLCFNIVILIRSPRCAYFYVVFGWLLFYSSNHIILTSLGWFDSAILSFSDQSASIVCSMASAIIISAVHIWPFIEFEHQYFARHAFPNGGGHLMGSKSTKQSPINIQSHTNAKHFRDRFSIEKENEPKKNWMKFTYSQLSVAGLVDPVRHTSPARPSGLPIPSSGIISSVVESRRPTNKANKINVISFRYLLNFGLISITAVFGNATVTRDAWSYEYVYPVLRMFIFVWKGTIDKPEVKLMTRLHSIDFIVCPVWFGWAGCCSVGGIRHCHSHSNVFITIVSFFKSY